MFAASLDSSVLFLTSSITQMQAQLAFASGTASLWTESDANPELFPLLAPHCLSIRDHILIVLLHGAGKAVVTLGVGDKIVVIALGGVHGGF